METNELGPRPSNPSEISFDRSCFELAGTKVEFVVLRSTNHSGPARFDSESQDKAREYAKRVGGEVIRQEIPVMRRVRWTAK